ncbi:MAG: ribonuclease HIII [Chlamydiota bacterium]
MTRPACFVTTIDLKHAEKLQSDLKEQGFVLAQGPYMVFQAKKKGVSCTLYESGKLTVQGKEKDDFITYYLEPELLKTFAYSYPEIAIDVTPRIGVDEAGKGDVFGPLCICALYADQQAIETLIQLGIKDSKKLTDRVIKKHAKVIKQHCNYHLVELFPSRYNALYNRFQNLNHMLAWGHATALEELLQEVNCRKVVIDQFAAEHVVESAVAKKNLSIDLKQRYRGEEDIVVAAASILARAAFVDAIDRLSTTYDLLLPKGASKEVRAALQLFYHKHGKEALTKVAKLHFKTIRELIDQG